MLELYIIRHGLAGKPLEEITKDEARALTKKGKEKIKEISKGLKELDIKFDIVISSPLLRARETAEIVNEYCGEKAQVKDTDLLIPGASYDNLIKYLNKLKGYEKVAIVGHEPFLSGFASYCLSKNKNSFINLKKGGVIKLDIDQVIKPGMCMLSWLMEPNPLTHIK